LVVSLVQFDNALLRNVSKIIRVCLNNPANIYGITLKAELSKFNLKWCNNWIRNNKRNCHDFDIGDI